MDFKLDQFQFRPHKMWAWNEKLNTGYIQSHISRIAQAGYGSFCICADGGLENKYMGDEWMRTLASAIEKAKENSLEVWVSDEFGSFSGCGNGTVNSSGLEYQQKFLCCEVGNSTNDFTIICKDGYHFYYDVNPYYADLLNPDVANLFIDNVCYYNTENIDGILSINPQLSYKKIPWSFTLPAQYKAEYDEELLELLPQLFNNVGNYKSTRIKFWTLVTKLFSKNFLMPLKQKANKNGILYSATVPCRGAYDFTTSGNMMFQFVHMDIPTISIASKDADNPLYAIMAASAKEQFNKKESIASLFENAGNGATFSDLKRFANLQFANGITKIATACESSSLRGMRKRTNSTASYLREDLIEAYNKFSSYITRVSSAMSLGKSGADTLLISNLANIWSEFNGAESDRINEISSVMSVAVKELTEKHIPFHIGDELVLKEYGYVQGDALCIGDCSYKTVVIPDGTVLLASTEKFLSEFEHRGGFIAYTSSLSENAICDNSSIIYTSRICDGYSLHYFFNNSNEEITSSINAGTKMLDLSSGEVVPFYGVYKFSPYESIIVINDQTPEISRPFIKPLKTLDLGGEWTVNGGVKNILVIDKCDVLINGETVAENINAVDVTELIYSNKTPVVAECVFKFNVSETIDSIHIANESLNRFDIKINGSPSIFEGTDYNIAQYLMIGENVISLTANFSPSEKFLNAYTTATKSENELRKLYFDTEIESLYLVGDFSVKTDGDFRPLDKNAYRYIGDFSIESPNETLNISSLHTQGFPFFCGKLCLSKKFNLSDTQYCIKFAPYGINAITVTVNGKRIPPVIWEPYEVNLSEFLLKGDNEIEIEISTTMRNLFGPHHIPLGELYTVNSGDYYRGESVWNHMNPTPWDENYCFTKFGIESI